MARHEIRYTLDDGRRLTIPELVRSKDNTWPVSYQCVYERMRKGDRSIAALLRPPAHRCQAPQASKAEKVSPWRLGPAVRTQRSAAVHAQLHEEHRPDLDLSGARVGALTVLRHGPLLGGVATWTCQCDCGDRVTYRADTLRTGVQDCGCGISERETA